MIILRRKFTKISWRFLKWCNLMRIYDQSSKGSISLDLLLSGYKIIWRLLKFLLNSRRMKKGRWNWSSSTCLTSSIPWIWSNSRISLSLVNTLRKMHCHRALMILMNPIKVRIRINSKLAWNSPGSKAQNLPSSASWLITRRRRHSCCVRLCWRKIRRSPLI